MPLNIRIAVVFPGPAAQPVATQCRLLQQTADCCNLLQRLQRSAVRWQQSASPLPVCDVLRGVPGLRVAGVRLHVAQPVATQPPRPVRAVASSPNWNLAEAGVSASIPEDAGPRLQQESLASD